MLLDSKYTIVPQLRFSLTYDDGVRKVITVKTRDTIACTYKKNGERFSITGIVTKIGCNFNSSLGAVGTTAYIQVDGSSEYSGEIAYIEPSAVLELTVISTTDITENIVCSVDNDDQRVCLIRENEAGLFQYSLDGITWKNTTTGKQGMSAYECAVALGFVGTEEEWLESLKGEPGEPGEAGALEIYKVFKSIEAAEDNRDLIPKGKLIAVTGIPSSILFVRNGKNSSGVCPCCGEDVEAPQAKGYDFLGYLSLGPQGEKGDPGNDGNDGKSAYQYAVEGGFPGTEAEFMHILGRSAVAVTNFYMGPSNIELDNTVIGPIDLKIFGYTNVDTFVSKSITKIDIKCPIEAEDQSLIFPEPIILRAVPVSGEAAKPNVVIRGKKYVADAIQEKDGQIGVWRRVKYYASYNGETIIGEWISSTGELDLGAQVQCVGYGKFEPFAEEIQSQYRKLHSFDGSTKIIVTEGTYISVAYPIDIKKFVEGYVSEYVDRYLDEHGEEVIVPIVERTVDAVIDRKIAGKQDKLTAGRNINIDENNVISAEGSNYTAGNHIEITEDNEINVKDIGDLGESATVTDYVDNKINAAKTDLNTKINRKQNTLTAGENITIENDVISCTAQATLGKEITVKKTVGGIEAGTVIPADTTIAEIIEMILAPEDPPVPPEDSKAYFGVSKNIPTSLEGLTGREIDKEAVITNGISNRYTANDERYIYAYPKSMGELISIKDSSGFEQLDGWSRVEVVSGTTTFYVYYTNETLETTSFKVTFIYTEE